MNKYTLQNGQPAIKQISKFICDLQINHTLRRELSYEYIVNHIFYNSKREWLRSKFPEFPTKKLKQIEFII